MEYYVVDAFTHHLFGGNPAGICLVDSPLPVELMQNIAAENNLPETAYVVPKGDEYDIRWFTPEEEIDLCGHATLASAYILSRFKTPEKDNYVFHSPSGPLGVTRKGDLLEMDFPSRPAEPVQVTPAMAEAIGAPVLEAHLARDLVLVVDSADAVLGLVPDMEKLKAIPNAFAVVVTARGDGEVDFVSRFFAPGAGIPEDPVTGSSHSTLIPFWASRLGKDAMVAKQLSKRGGTLHCRNDGSRVVIGGYAQLYLRGTLELD